MYFNQKRHWNLKLSLQTDYNLNLTDKKAVCFLQLSYF
ncbi:hypothetical protein NC99_24470 [Sunxiuqinia dokdonensis]|uniref:Uncharacterized protein n=1 Tax=Sunxiuqinia dokdonensis TaxID=1409788 RepID=A0A0L8V9C8_9BACT|nr:hypothetical protein NC99_24470 [Sunxiuqinia dokdonensis]